MVLITLLPWTGLYAVLVGSAVWNRWGIVVGGATLRVAEAVLVPFALRAVLFTRPELKPRWGPPEWLIAGFIGVNFLSTYFYARVQHSELAAIIEFLGAIAYLAIFTSVVTPERLKKATKIFLFGGAAGAAIGLFSLAGYYAGLSYGVDFRYTPALGGAPAIRGIAYEHDLFGSTCAAVAIAFLILMREHSDLFKKRWTEIFFWVSSLGMLVSQARGAWIAYALVFIAYAVGLRRRRVFRASKMLRSATILLVCGIGALGYLYAAGGTSTDTYTPSPIAGVAITTTQKLTSAINFSSTSNSSSCDGCNSGAGRLRRLTKGLNEVLPVSPFIGLGTDSYGLRNFKPSSFTWPYLAPAYLEILYGRTIYDTGILGLVLLVLFFGYLVWPRKEIQHSPGDLAPISRALTFAGLTIVIAYGVTDGTFLIWPWLLFGLIRASMLLAQRQARDLRGAAPAASGAAGHKAIAVGGNGSAALAGGNGGDPRARFGRDRFSRPS